MKGTTNHAIGTAGEKRIIKKLEKYGATILENGNHNEVPDIRFKVAATEYSAELKTMLLVHDGGKAGTVKLSRHEFNSMQEIPGNKCMIVEFRSHGRSIKSYVVVPWGKVVEKLQDRMPLLASIELSWILQNMTPLSLWLTLQWTCFSKAWRWSKKFDIPYRPLISISELTKSIEKAVGGENVN